MAERIYSTTDIANAARAFVDLSEYKTRKAIDAANIKPDYVGGGTQFYSGETAQAILKLLADAAIVTLNRQRDHALLDLDESIAADFPHAVTHARARLNAIETAIEMIRDPEKLNALLQRFNKED